MFGRENASVKKLDWLADQTGPRSSSKPEPNHIKLMLSARANVLGLVSARPDAHTFAFKPARDQAHMASRQMALPVVFER
jgi:hypothetical protein